MATQSSVRTDAAYPRDNLAQRFRPLLQKNEPLGLSLNPKPLPHDAEQASRTLKGWTSWLLGLSL